MRTLTEQLLEALASHVSYMTASSILTLSRSRSKVNLTYFTPDDSKRLLGEIEHGLRTFLRDEKTVGACMARVSRILQAPAASRTAPAPAEATGATTPPRSSRTGTDPKHDTPPRTSTAAARPSTAILPEASTETITVPIRNEGDIVRARSTARSLCCDIGFSQAQQVRVATAVSELARNIVYYAVEGEVELSLLDTTPPGIQAIARDEGPGIPNLDDILNGNYQSKLGMGMGLRGTRNLVDEFDVKTEPGKGTVVVVRAFLR
jgi:serine/threonine-protein kinase RsbT